MPKPRAGESKSSYISRCVREVMGEGRDQKAAVGKCEGMWREYHHTKSFADCIKDVTAQGVHAITALGNEDKDKKRKKPRRKILTLKVAKVDADQQIIGGWASIVAYDGKPVVDSQDDIIPVNELEQAAERFLLDSRKLGDMHTRLGTGRITQSFVYTPTKAKLGHIAKDDKGRQIYGWWVEFKVDDAEAWKACKSGERLELSIGGAAVPIHLRNKRRNPRYLTGARYLPSYMLDYVGHDEAIEGFEEERSFLSDEEEEDIGSESEDDRADDMEEEEEKRKVGRRISPGVGSGELSRARPLHEIAARVRCPR
jgi:hypothetical protein